MPLELEELAGLVTSVAEEHGLTVAIVGVTPTGGNGNYAEVLVNVVSYVGANRLSIGLHRDASVTALRRVIAAQLDSFLAS
jgi:hypothetical protein